MNTLTQETQNKRRNNIKSCIIESWKVFALNTKHYFKYTGCHFLIAGLGFALFTAETTWFLTKYIQPIATVISAGYDPTIAKAIFSPSVSSYLTLAVAILAFIVANCLMYGAVFSQIRFYKAMDCIPTSGPFSFWKEVRQYALKTFTIDVIFLFVLSLCVGIVALIAHFTSQWMMVAALPVIIYWVVIATCGRLQYVTENKQLKPAIKDAFHFGHKKFGGYLILIVLTGIPMWMIAYAALLPTHVIQFSVSADVISRLAGDPSGIPPYVLPLYIAIAALGYFIFGMAYSLQQWPLALYTSAISKDKVITK